MRTFSRPSPLQPTSLIQHTHSFEMVIDQHENPYWMRFGSNRYPPYLQEPGHQEMGIFRPRTCRPVTEDVRQSIIEDFPEIAQIASAELRNKVVEAWSLALCSSSFERACDIPGAGNPGDLELVRGNQTDHIRAVARIATHLARDFAEHYPEVDIDHDIVLAGALIHDIGKAFEFDPENLDRWNTDPSRFGQPSLRHSVYGAHICLVAELPEELAHIALGHSREGQHIGLSLECMFVRIADHSWWELAAASGLIKPETIASASKMTRPRKLKHGS